MKLKKSSFNAIIVIIIRVTVKRGLTMRGNLILLFVAMIWGAAFVAQKTGMDYVGAFTFNGVRFALGAISLIPLIYFFSRQNKAQENEGEDKAIIKIGFMAGLVMFCAISLQQIGLIYTTAGKTAFITCLYIVLVPLIGVFLGNRLKLNTVLGVLLAVVGLYFLCVKENFLISYGDFLVLICSLFWAIHILLIDRYAKNLDSINRGLSTNDLGYQIGSFFCAWNIHTALDDFLAFMQVRKRLHKLDSYWKSKTPLNLIYRGVCF